MIGTASGPQLHSTAEIAKPASSAKRQAILVLGMHRSGTSALAGVINALGAALPQKTLMGPHPCNERGFFESLAIAVAHDDMLASAGSCWHDWRRLSPDWFCTEAARRHREKIKSVFVDEFGDQPFIVLKDPRICRFVPFTLSVLADLNISTVAVLPVRNPLEVAYSLQRRDGFPLSKSLLIWLRHVLDAEVGSRNLRRCFLSYEGFLADWRSELDRVSQKIGAAWPSRSDMADAKIDQFLTTELRHQRVSGAEFNTHPEATSWVRDTYAILKNITASGEDQHWLDQLEAMRVKFNEACHLFARTVPNGEGSKAKGGLTTKGETSPAEFDSRDAQGPSVKGQSKAVGAKAPEISIIVVVYNMLREAPRMLRSLAASYQRHVDPEDYEVIVVDNGSSPPFDENLLDALEGNFRLIRIDPAPPSPARAVNIGLAEARGEIIGVMIDGARIVTPGFIHFGRRGARLYPRAVVATLIWHLGRDYQRWAMEAGYDQTREDELLASIGWPQDGYRLFDIGAFDESSTDGWFAPIAESNGLFMSRETWNLLDGVDERFDAPGGGYLNVDAFIRALELPGSELVILLGEATFHQFHGGIATNADHRTFPAKLTKWQAQYEAIRGRPLTTPLPRNRTYLGVLPPAALPHFARSIVEPARGLPLGPSFDRTLWSLSPSPRPTDPVCAALLDLAESEFRDRQFEAAAAVARMARSRAPDEPGPQRLLASAGPWLRGEYPPDDRRASFHFARGRAYRLLGDTAAARAEFCAALAWDPDLPDAHNNVAELRWPGEDYLERLARLHLALSPEVYLEIGVAHGRSLALAKPPTRAVGIDPRPLITEQFRTETQIFVETSDEFFARRRLDNLLDGGTVDFAFIDGFHLFERALRDFVNIEAHCSRHSVVAFHNTLPLDEPTQQRARTTTFYTGDVWKAVLCLKFYRPDLDIFTIATPPTGLTIVTGLNPKSEALSERFDEAVARFIDFPYAELENQLATAINLIANDWNVIERRLRAGAVFRTLDLNVQLEDAG